MASSRRPTQTVPSATRLSFLDAPIEGRILLQRPPKDPLHLWAFRIYRAVFYRHLEAAHRFHQSFCLTKNLYRQSPIRKHLDQQSPNAQGLQRMRHLRKNHTLFLEHGLHAAPLTQLQISLRSLQQSDQRTFFAFLFAPKASQPRRLFRRTHTILLSENATRFPSANRAHFSPVQRLSLESSKNRKVR